jgi:acetoacetate decarboxylase
MKLADVRRNAFAMPLTDTAYPPGPYKFYNREFVVITYRTDPDRLREVVPEPLEVAGDTVAYEFIRMDSTGFGDYTETGQVIPVCSKAKDGAVQESCYVHAMYLDDDAPIAGGREIWGSRRNWRARRSRTKETWSSARCITARCSAYRLRWASSTARSTRRRY